MRLLSVKIRSALMSCGESAVKCPKTWQLAKRRSAPANRCLFLMLKWGIIFSLSATLGEYRGPSAIFSTSFSNCVFLKNLISPVPFVYNMVARSEMFNSQWPWHVSSPYIIMSSSSKTIEYTPSQIVAKHQKHQN